MLLCTQCERPLGEQGLGLPELDCSWCGAHLEVQVFPALRQGATQGGTGERLDDESEAACFNHSDKKAVAHCARCGRFLCALCEVSLTEGVVCFDCFATGASEGSGGLERRAVLYDSVALSLAVVPIIFWILTVVTAPLALFVVIRYWKRPGGLVPRSKVRFVVAAGLALMQLTGWAVLAIGLVTSGALSG
jgi:hypothetical protein